MPSGVAASSTWSLYCDLYFQISLFGNNASAMEGEESAIVQVMLTLSAALDSLFSLTWLRLVV